MIKLLHWWLSALCGLILMALSISAATAETRVALVVGNSLYKNASLALLNPKNDAHDVAAVLRTLGFEVIVAIDATKRDLDLAMTQFARSATNADTALFYYAGHAIQYQGRNYLMPIDAELEDEISLRYQTTSLEDVRAAIDRAGGVKIMILDACRNNPIVDDLKRKMMGASRSIDLTRGLARIDRAQGIVVAYATAADEVASDGPGRNSPFTTALIKRLQDPGLEIAKMFRRIAADVNEMTNGRQRPEIYVSLIDEYFINQKDRLVWDQIKETTDPKAFRDFVANFPSSPRVSDAQYRLETLEQLARERQMEKERAEQEALRARRQEAERERIERETARRQTEEAAKPEAAKQEAATLVMLDQERRAKPAEADREKQARLTAEPGPQPKPNSVPGLSQEQNCKLEEEWLTRLRANPVADQIARLERELSCTKLRPQIARLRESVSDAHPQNVTPPLGSPRPQPEPPRQQVEPTQPKADPGPQKTATAPPPSSLSPSEVCKRDEATLARLRASPAPDEIARFERDLGCARLRPQVVRLRESVSAN
jgi:hypothetical protein